MDEIKFFIQDDYLTSLLYDVQRWQIRTIKEWKTAPSSDGVVLNWLNHPTHMPDYKSYCETWEVSGVQNPFNTNWISSLNNIQYIGFISEAMNEQATLWSSYSELSPCMAYGSFITYADRVENVYKYIMEATLKWRIIP